METWTIEILILVQTLITGILSKPCSFQQNLMEKEIYLSKTILGLKKLIMIVKSTKTYGGINKFTPK